MVIALDQLSQDYVIQVEKLAAQVLPQRLTLSTPTPDPPVLRPLEYLDVRSVDAQTLDRMSLRRLRLHMLGDLQSIHQLAEFFLNITWLSLPAVYLAKDAIHPANVKLVHNPQNHRYPSMNLMKSKQQEEWFSILSLFPNLEVFRGWGYGPPSIQRRKRCIRLSCNLSNFAQSFVNSTTAISTRSAWRGGELPLSGRASLARG